MKKVIIVAMLVLFLVACVPVKQKEAVYCAQDVQQCADGSYVARDPNNGCQFRPCPVSVQPKSYY